MSVKNQLPKSHDPTCSVCLVLWCAPTKTARVQGRPLVMHCVVTMAIFEKKKQNKRKKTTSVRLWSECLGGWVGESMLTLSHKRPLFTPGSNDILTHTRWITPPLNRSCHNITQLIQRVEAASKAPAGRIKLPVEQLLVCTLHCCVLIIIVCVSSSLGIAAGLGR